MPDQSDTWTWEKCIPSHVTKLIGTHLRVARRRLSAASTVDHGLRDPSASRRLLWGPDAQVRLGGWRRGGRCYVGWRDSAIWSFHTTYIIFTQSEPTLLIHTALMLFTRPKIYIFTHHMLFSLDLNKYIHTPYVNFTRPKINIFTHPMLFSLDLK